MITNPDAGTFTESGWALGFAFGFMDPRFSDAPPALIAPELIDAFNEGRLVGQQTAIDGLSLTPECMDASQEGSNAAEGLVAGIHILEGLGTAVDFLASHVDSGVAGNASNFEITYLDILDKLRANVTKDFDNLILPAFSANDPHSQTPQLRGQRSRMEEGFLDGFIQSE